jgi:tankyrase
MFTNVFDFKPDPTAARQTKLNEASAIEHKFSRIAKVLTTLWQRDDIDAYLNNLMLDDRGNRQGFPDDVLEEIMFLSSIRWQLLHPTYKRADEGLVEQFSFNTLPQLDSRYCEPGRHWVLG